MGCSLRYTSLASPVNTCTTPKSSLPSGSDLPVETPSSRLLLLHDRLVSGSNTQKVFQGFFGTLPVQTPYSDGGGLRRFYGRARWSISASIRDPQFTAARRMWANGIRPPGTTEISQLWRCTSAQEGEMEEPPTSATVCPDPRCRPEADDRIPRTVGQITEGC